MSNFTLRSHEGTGLYLSADGPATARRNISIRARVSGSLDQTWRILQPEDGARVRIYSCRADNTAGYCLNNATASHNCDMIPYEGNYKDSLVELESYGVGIYYIRSITDGRYLTADGTSTTSNVSWQPRASSIAQRWKFTTVSDGAGFFSVKSFADGLNSNVIHTSSNSKIQVYRLSSTQKLRLALVMANYALNNSLLAPTGKTVSAKTNCAFFNSENQPSFNGVFKVNGKIYYGGKEVTLGNAADDKLLTTFFDDGTHYPCFCMASSGLPTIKWFNGLTGFKGMQSQYEYIFSGGHALVYDDKNPYNYEVINDRKLPIACPLIYAPTSNHVSGTADYSWDEPDSKRQRTFVCYAYNRYYLIVSNSMTIFDAAQVAADLGSSWAMSLDGGGSTSMYVGSSYVISSSRRFSTALCACTN